MGIRGEIRLSSEYDRNSRECGQGAGVGSADGKLLRVGHSWTPLTMNPAEGKPGAHTFSLGRRIRS